MHTRRSCRQFRVALVGHGADRAAVGDQKIGAGNAHVGRHEPAAQMPSGTGHHRFHRCHGTGIAVMRAKQLTHLLAGFVQRGPDDMRRRVARELDDVFSQIGFHPLDPGLLKRVRKTNLLAQHGFGAGHGFCVSLAADIDDDSASLRAGFRPMHLGPGSDGVLFERNQVVFEISNHMVFDVAPEVACNVEFRPRSHGGGTLAARGARGAIDGEFQRRTGQSRIDARGESGGHASPPMAGSSPIPAKTSAAW
ncbi:hypothetical protein GALL_529460 [mine drainage metagenome]|uniref:Uncharacterized protein n=1 Tax=mine drainage metagenome TaxID=410659 RepID=A0A1J5PPL1_9ZZZZ